MNSIDSVSSLFDRYSQECVTSAHTTVEIGKPPIFETNECNEKVYSQYEPVNHILNTLFNSKYTLNKLGKTDDLVFSFLEYWKIEDEQFQILQMLEPELLKKQTAIFQIYYNLQTLKGDIESEMQDNIPKYLAQLDDTKRTQVYHALSSMQSMLTSLCSDLKYILQSNIITNTHSFSRRIITDFQALESSPEFISGISYFCNDLPMQLTGLAVKLSLLKSIIPITSLHTDLDPIKQCLERVAEKIDHERTRYDIFLTVTQLPQLLILIPFITVCWILFSIKGFLKRSF